MKYSNSVEKLAKELRVDPSVAMDIEYLRICERRILRIAQMKNSRVRNFNVYNKELEQQLDILER